MTGFLRSAVTFGKALEKVLLISGREPRPVIIDRYFCPAAARNSSDPDMRIRPCKLCGVSIRLTSTSSISTASKRSSGKSVGTSVVIKHPTSRRLLTRNALPTTSSNTRPARFSNAALFWRVRYLRDDRYLINANVPKARTMIARIDINPMPSILQPPVMVSILMRLNASLR
nr:hypothetical protein [Caballeronia sp. SBC2]